MIFSFITLALIALSVPQFASAEPITRSNSLQNSPSLHLQEHASSPIWWMPWESKYLEIASKLNLPIFLSVGSSAGHLSNVMLIDSFQQLDVAELLNKNFISIKVDQEQQPDIARLYASAVQTMTGREELPLTLVLTPDLKPIWGGTFVEHSELKTAIARIVQTWHSSEKERLFKTANDVTNQMLDFLSPKAATKNYEISEDPLRQFYLEMLTRFDKNLGGFTAGRKTLPSQQIRTLLRIFRRTAKKNALDMSERTLQHLAVSGIHDQVGGGFHQQSIDEAWNVPTFEKVLGENSLIALTYLEAWQVTKNPSYKALAQKTIDFILRDLSSKGGGFFSTVASDVNKSQGGYYLWTEAELRSVLGDKDFVSFSKIFSIRSEGNFRFPSGASAIEASAGFSSPSGQNILHAKLDAYPKFTSDEYATLSKNLEALRLVRSKRNPPKTSGNILAGQNGLVISLLSQGAIAFDQPELLSVALLTGKFIEARLVSNDSLMRVEAQGKAFGLSSAEDYAFVISGFLSLFETTQDRHWIERAIALQAKQDSLFWNPDLRLYFDGQSILPAINIRTANLNDQTLPSANSQSGINLLRLHQLTGQESFRHRSSDLFQTFSPKFRAHAVWFPTALMGLDLLTDNHKELIVISPEEWKDPTKVLQSTQFSRFAPNQTVLLGSGKAGLASTNEPNVLKSVLNKQAIRNEITYYVCENRTCKLPTSDVSKAITMLDQVKPYTVGKD